jgi:hypothetical protein
LKLVRDLKEIESRRPHIVILTGNGERERRRILPPLCEKYNGKAKFLWFPEPPKGKKETGLKPLNAIREHTIKDRLEKFLFLIDRKPQFEEIKLGREQEEVSRYLEKELKARIETTCELIPEKAFINWGYLGTRSFSVCTVIFGITSNVEEEISELIQLKFGIQVDPDKVEINEFLKKKGKKLENLVGEASKKYLEKAFPGLCGALKEIEEELGQ